MGPPNTLSYDIRKLFCCFPSHIQVTSVTSLCSPYGKMEYVPTAFYWHWVTKLDEHSLPLRKRIGYCNIIKFLGHRIQLLDQLLYTSLIHVLTIDVDISESRLGYLGVKNEVRSRTYRLILLPLPITRKSAQQIFHHWCGRGQLRKEEVKQGLIDRVELSGSVRRLRHWRCYTSYGVRTIASIICVPRIVGSKRRIDPEPHGNVWSTVENFPSVSGCLCSQI